MKALALALLAAVLLVQAQPAQAQTDGPCPRQICTVWVSAGDEVYAPRGDLARVASPPPRPLMLIDPGAGAGHYLQLDLTTPLHLQLTPIADASTITAEIMFRAIPGHKGPETRLRLLAGGAVQEHPVAKGAGAQRWELTLADDLAVDEQLDLFLVAVDGMVAFQRVVLSYRIPEDTATITPIDAAFRVTPDAGATLHGRPSAEGDQRGALPRGTAIAA